jgi:hypothetical protein
LENDMSRKALALALGMIMASPAAAYPAPVPPEAPAGTPDTRYCMRVDAITGSRIETVQCWTRAEWTDQGVNVDEDWAKEGVRVIA